MVAPFSVRDRIPWSPAGSWITRSVIASWCLAASARLVVPELSTVMNGTGAGLAGGVEVFGDGDTGGLEDAGLLVLALADGELDAGLGVGEPGVALADGDPAPALAPPGRCSAASAAPVAARCTAGRTRPNQSAASAMTPTAASAAALGSHDGIIAVRTMAPSQRCRSPSGGLAITWNWWVSLGPRQKRRRARTRTLAVAVAAGPTTRPGGITCTYTVSASSPPISSTLAGALPWLSMMTLWRLGRSPRPRPVRGARSAVTSDIGATARMPSSTTDPAGSSLEATRMANGSRPCGTCEPAGGRTMTRAAAVWPGNRDRTAGSHAAQAAASPITLSANESTTCPVLRTTISEYASPPGTTGRLSSLRVASAPMRLKLGRPECRDHASWGTRRYTGRCPAGQPRRAA